MATVTTPAYPRPRLRILRVVAFVLGVILPVLLVVCAWFYFMARSALPHWTGGCASPDFPRR
jgi:hypothetical protein